ncbi:MAG: ISAs1 family transposase [Akkermansiaceae bacterium]
MPINPDKTDYTGGFPVNFTSFENISDPRNGGNTLHHFGEIIFMAFTCILCGVKSYDLMQELCEIRIEWFRKWIKLPNGIPSYNTFARVFEAIDPVEFSHCIAMHLERAGVTLAPGQIAIDGKALRGSRSGEESHIHAVSAWACDKGITLAQCFVGEKSNEITAIPELLEILNLEGAVVTIDAMGTQRDIAEKIRDKGGDYIFCVKGNQGSLHKEIIDQFDFATRQLGDGELDLANWSCDETLGKQHGRIEKRQVVVCHNLDWMEGSIRNAWKGLGCIVMVSRWSDLGNGKTRSETSYYMSSLSDTPAKIIQGYIRSHWGIENGCHWVLDTLFREDHNQTRQRNAAKNLATMRRMALNILKLVEPEGKRAKSLPKRQLKAAHDEHYLEERLSLV